MNRGAVALRDAGLLHRMGGGYDHPMLSRLAIAALVAVLSAGRPSSAAPATTATPAFHGTLDMIAAHGTIDPSTGNATLKIRGWRLLLSPDSNGIFPDQEPMLIALAENNFYLAAGALKPSRRGRVFRYRAPRDVGPRAIRSLRLAERRDGIYTLSFTLTGVELSRLTIQDRDCVPMAFIVGDDDGFGGARLRRPSFKTRQIVLPGDCTADLNGAWPWA